MQSSRYFFCWQHHEKKSTNSIWNRSWNAFVSVIKIESGDLIWRKVSFSFILSVWSFWSLNKLSTLFKSIISWPQPNTLFSSTLWQRAFHNRFVVESVERSNPTASSFCFSEIPLKVASTHLLRITIFYVHIWNIIFYIETCEPATTLKNNFCIK